MRTLQVELDMKLEERAVQKKDAWEAYVKKWNTLWKYIYIFLTWQVFIVVTTTYILEHPWLSFAFNFFQHTISICCLHRTLLRQKQAIINAFHGEMYPFSHSSAAMWKRLWVSASSRWLFAATGHGAHLEPFWSSIGRLGQSCKFRSLSSTAVAMMTLQHLLGPKRSILHKDWKWTIDIHSTSSANMSFVVSLLLRCYGLRPWRE